MPLMMVHTTVVNLSRGRESTGAILMWLHFLHVKMVYFLVEVEVTQLIRYKIKAETSENGAVTVTNFFLMVWSDMSP